GLLDSEEASDELRQEVARVREDLDEAERLRAFVAALDDIRLRATESSGGTFDGAAAAAAYAAAFRRYGLDVLALGPDKAARRLLVSPQRERLVAALDEWESMTPEKGERDLLGRLTLAIDPDPKSLRNRWRKAREAKDRAG